MSWIADGRTITFTCDSCPEGLESTESVNAEYYAKPSESDFAAAWRIVQRPGGWRSFKRTGHSWTYHCAKCAPQAESEHAEHNRNEAERERIKARNESR